MTEIGVNKFYTVCQAELVSASYFVKTRDSETSSG
jgi:hypothetical protein